MAVRRPSSSTSLSRYHRESSPEPNQRSFDFCNAFWGFGDGGVDVLFARMRGAGRSMEELRAFWRERAAIEDDYAKRLAKLAKFTLGKDEIGELRNAFDTLRQETERQANSHQVVAVTMRRDLEGPTAEFIARQAHHKKTFHTNIEKSFKQKQTQEGYVNKAREKYEANCVQINLYTAQSTLSQGKDLEKINIKLERAKETVQQNERDFANFARALSDTTRRWEGEWKNFCDQCQDLEEDRIEFMKDNMWAYANAVSTVCVSDDESCEKIRVSLEQVDVEKDMENFVKEYGTGANIPDPPPFHSYASSKDPAPRPSSRPAGFSRSTMRTLPSRQSFTPADEEPTGPGNAGIGAGGRDSRSSSRGPVNHRSTTPAAAATPSESPTTHAPAQNYPPQQQYHQQPPAAQQQQHQPRQQSPPQYHNQAPPSQQQAPPPQQPHQPQQQQAAQYGYGSAMPQALPGMTTGSAPNFRSQQPQQQYTDQYGDTIRPASQVQLRVGNNAYDVDPSADPQMGGSNHQPGSNRNTLPPQSVGDESDPIARALAALRNGSSPPDRNSVVSTNRTTPSSIGRSSSNAVRQSGAGNVNRSTTLAGAHSQPSHGSARRGTDVANQRSPSPMNRSISSVNRRGNEALAPTAAQRISMDYQASADSVVGAYPGGGGSRSTSPAVPPQAVFMQAPKLSTSPGPIEDVVQGYSQMLPSERRQSVRRSMSPNPGRNAPAYSPNQDPRASQIQVPQNPAAGRPRTPSVGRDGFSGIGAQGRSSSPQFVRPASRGPSPQPQAYPGQNIPPPAASQNPQRAVSPSQLGIALDSSGRVAQDSLADEYARRSGRPTQQPQHQAPPQQTPQQVGPPPTQIPPHQQQLYQQQPAYAPGPPPPLQQYPPASAYNQAPPQPQQSYPSYTQPTPAQQIHQAYQQSQSGYLPPPQTNGYHYQDPSRGGSVPAPQQQQPPQQQYGGYPSVSPSQSQPYIGGFAPPGQRAPSPAVHAQQAVRRSPSPARPGPSGGFNESLEDGTGVLFYVKALYDYTATIDEEFDFQSGDIIAVTATPEDGWWSGVLLDDTRRVPGRTIFPSNFVCLF